MNIETIHESLVNGRRKQMVEQIEEYGLYAFWPDYKCFLAETYATVEAAHSYFTDAVISYFRIKER